MGTDCSCHQCFAAAADARRRRQELLRHLTSSMRRAGYVPASAPEGMPGFMERRLVIGPPGRWIWVGDSAASTGDWACFEQLARDLSTFVPVVDMWMSDSAAVHFSLYEQGQLRDQCGNLAFPFFEFETAAEALAFRGQPERWTRYVLDPTQTGALRAAWVQGLLSSATEILERTAVLLGWHPVLCPTGYTVHPEGLPVSYKEYVAGRMDLAGCRAYHFAGEASRRGARGPGEARVGWGGQHAWSSGAVTAGTRAPRWRHRPRCPAGSRRTRRRSHAARRRRHAPAVARSRPSPPSAAD